MNCGEWCMCFWCSLYGGYCALFCGTLCREIYNERIEEYKKIKEGYDNLPKQVSQNIEMKIERLATKPLSTIMEEPEGYQDFRLHQNVILHQ
tara:strand:- start:3061 stop:3336 length:276 start_codon:yes stop_codon:yes gene_type:complete